MLSGPLLLARCLIDAAVGPPPSTGAELLVWAAAHRLPLAIGNELLMVAVVCLVPAVPALARALRSNAEGSATLGSGLLALALPLLAMLDLIEGRRVFPVYGIAVSPEAAALLTSLSVGGAHAVDLLLAVATVALSVALRRSGWGARLAGLGFVSGALDVAGAYPWLTGPAPLVLGRAVLAAWFVALGSALIRR